MKEKGCIYKGKVYCESCFPDILARNLSSDERKKIEGEIIPIPDNVPFFKKAPTCCDCGLPISVFLKK